MDTLWQRMYKCKIATSHPCMLCLGALVSLNDLRKQGTPGGYKLVHCKPEPDPGLTWSYALETSVRCAGTRRKLNRCTAPAAHGSQHTAISTSQPADL